MTSISTITPNQLSRLADVCRQLEHLVATQAWDEITDLAPEMEQFCDLLSRVDLSGSPELLLQAENFVVLEQKIRPILAERLQDLRHELFSQQNSSRLNNTYSL